MFIPKLPKRPFHNAAKPSSPLGVNAEINDNQGNDSVWGKSTNQAVEIWRDVISGGRVC